MILRLSTSAVTRDSSTITCVSATAPPFSLDHGDRGDDRRLVGLEDPAEAFFLRVYGSGGYLFKGADLGILVTKSRMQTEGGELTTRCRQFIEGIHEGYEATPIDAAVQPSNLLAFLK